MTRSLGSNLVSCFLAGVIGTAGCGGAAKDVKSADGDKRKVAIRPSAPDEGETTPAPDPEQERLDGLLVAAIEEGDWQEALGLLEEGADEQAVVGHKGFTTLHLAAMRSDHEWISELLEAGKDVNTTGPGGETPLHLAAWSGDVESTTLLLDGDADAAAVDEKGWGLLHWAALGGDVEMLEFLIVTRKMKLPKAGDDAPPVLIPAVQSDSLEAVKLLVSKGARVNVADAEGMTPLHHAVAGGHLEIAKFLVTKNAKAGVKDAKDRTPLHLLAESCTEGAPCIDLAKMLVKKGAKKKLVDAEGRTAHDYALEAQDEDMIAFLDPDAK